MKKIIGTGIAAAALLAAAPAFAADMSQPYPTKAPAAIIAPAFNWTGFYLGVNAGYGWGSGSGLTDDLGIDPDGWLAGGQIGVNYQFGNNVVLGAEADIQGSDFKDNDDFYGVRSKMDYFGTVRARLGYAFDNVLPYVTGGLAWGHNEIKYDGFTSDKTHVGWTVGGGVEWGFAPNWTAKAEYLYMDFGDEYYDSIGADAGLTANVLRAGLNYKF
ncbi:outer membrane protein [Bosea sp. 117]|uniref:outer membrane protein n=1 Tax=Bosea sp. 117 TaxID=1125973 RepID=UPI000494CC20|nr:outer membrane protein [Bosea sp. 117]